MRCASPQSACGATEPSSWRAAEGLSPWLARRGRIGIGGVDTRRLTRAVRLKGAPHVAIAHAADGALDPAALVEKARAFNGLTGADLAKDVSCAQSYRWEEMRWAWPGGFEKRATPGRRVVAVDYGAKRNILRCLASAGCDVTVLPATATAEDVLAHDPEGVFLSNGPGDPAATGAYAVPMIQGVLKAGLPMFGICLGHQMLALALGGKTVKMSHGHHGANHPVKDLATGQVEITSQNHGFAVDAASLPDNLTATHKSLFDDSLQGIERSDKPAFGFQGHPEASPGPHDVAPLFDHFIELMANSISNRPLDRKEAS